MFSQAKNHDWRNLDLCRGWMDLRFTCSTFANFFPFGLDKPWKNTCKWAALLSTLRDSKEHDTKHPKTRFPGRLWNNETTEISDETLVVSEKKAAMESVPLMQIRQPNPPPGSFRFWVPKVPVLCRRVFSGANAVSFRGCSPWWIFCSAWNLGSKGCWIGHFDTTKWLWN